MGLCVFLFFGCKKDYNDSVSVPVTENRSSNSSTSPNPDSLWIAQNYYKYVPAVNISNRSELQDGIITVSEASTLYTAFNFVSTQDMINSFRELNSHINKMTVAEGGGGASMPSAEGSFISPNNAATPCTDKAIGTFIQATHACAAFALLPVAGEVLCGGCMVGAIINFKADLDECEAEGQL